MKRIIKLDTTVSIISHAAVGGREERLGPLGERFDFCDTTNLFGQKTFELSEGEMGRVALNTALTKANLSHENLELLVAGDLQNQCVGTSLGLSSFGIPFVGVYGACSTCTEALIVLSSIMNTGEHIAYGGAVTSSHNCSAERQFRTPLEYGGQRPPSAQWTSTAAGAFVLGRDAGAPRISEFTIGKMVDGATVDGTNMGAAMSFAAADTILSYFDESGASPFDFDFIVTGDLGRVGSDILCDIVSKEIPGFDRLHADCGLLLYDSKTQDAHSGASGCGTSASVLASHFLPMMERGLIKRILFMSTGALMSPSSVLQGVNIAGIAPLIKIELESTKKKS
ncbi:MAG: stage V sporulation protein AD [Clostridia bacterium]|nr:stage V sporulation protein AD [Clostridia bacterium]